MTFFGSFHFTMPVQVVDSVILFTAPAREVVSSVSTAVYVLPIKRSTLLGIHTFATCHVLHNSSSFSTIRWGRAGFIAFDVVSCPDLTRKMCLLNYIDLRGPRYGNAIMSQYYIYTLVYAQLKCCHMTGNLIGAWKS